MDTKHTPGPWEARRAKFKTDGEYDFAVGATVDGKHYCIAEAFGRAGPDIRPNAEANARLIAAAPDMLAALKEMLFHFGNPQRDEWLNDEAFKLAKDADQRARAVLAKAEGR